MQLFNVCTKKVIEIEGEKKIKYYKVGVMKITEKGNMYLTLFHQPETCLQIFEQNPDLPVIQ